MHDDLAIAIGVIVVVGVGAQWVASALRVPSVLVLLPAGVVAGPITGLVDPDALFGDALFAVVSVAVALVLFEGGTSLRVAGAGELRRPVVGLVTVGALVTLAAGGLAATALLRVPVGTGLVLGAILVVSGPTVVLPLLDAVRLRPRVGALLRWEAILVDPIGAVVAVGVFEAVREGHSAREMAEVVAVSAAVGVACGALAALGLALLLRHLLVPDRLHNPVTLAVVVGTFVMANQLGAEAGLFAVTVMGVVLANQRLAPVAHISSFGEDVGVLLLGGLFVTLGATIDLDAARRVLVPSLALLAVLQVARVLAVWTATLGAGLTVRERAYLALIAPRGVVAASIAALFGVQLQADGVAGADALAPAAFIVVVGSVALVSVVARPAARWLRVDDPEPLGILVAGDAAWLVDAAGVLADHEVPVLVVHLDGDGEETAGQGVLVYQGAVEDDALAEAIEALGIAEAVVATDAEGADAFLVEHLSEILGRRHVYRVDRATPVERTGRARAWGRSVFPDLSTDTEAAAERDGRRPPTSWSVRAFAGEAVPAGAIPLFLLRDGRAPVVVADAGRAVDPDATVVVAMPGDAAARATGAR